MTVVKDGTAVVTPSWITLNSDQAAPGLTVSSNDNSDKGVYVVTVTSSLYDKADSFSFDIQLSPLSCILNTIGAGVLSIPTMEFRINLPSVSSEFDEFTSSLPACNLKYTFSITGGPAAHHATVLGLTKTSVAAGFTNINDPSIISSAGKIKVSF
jgi:hypothetical protein